MPQTPLAISNNCWTPPPFGIFFWIRAWYCKDYNELCCDAWMVSTYIHCLGVYSLLQESID